MNTEKPKPIIIVAIVATGSLTLPIEESLSEIEDELQWKKICFSLKYFREDSIKQVRKEIVCATKENLFVRTNLRGGRFLSRMAKVDGWEILFVEILPECEGELYRGKHTPSTCRLFKREELCLKKGKPFDERLVHLDPWTTANNLLLAYWNKYSTRKEAFAV